MKEEVEKSENKPPTQPALSSKELHVNLERFNQMLGMPMSTPGKKVVMNFGTDVRQFVLYSEYYSPHFR